MRGYKSVIISCGSSEENYISVIPFIYEGYDDEIPESKASAIESLASQLFLYYWHDKFKRKESLTNFIHENCSPPPERAAYCPECGIKINKTIDFVEFEKFIMSLHSSNVNDSVFIEDYGSWCIQTDIPLLINEIKPDYGIVYIPENAELIITQQIPKHIMSDETLELHREWMEGINFED